MNNARVNIEPARQKEVKARHVTRPRWGSQCLVRAANSAAGNLVYYFNFIFLFSLLIMALKGN